MTVSSPCLKADNQPVIPVDARRTPWTAWSIFRQADKQLTSPALERKTQDSPLSFDELHELLQHIVNKRVRTRRDGAGRVCGYTIND